MNRFMTWFFKIIIFTTRSRHSSPKLATVFFCVFSTTKISLGSQTKISLLSRVKWVTWNVRKEENFNAKKVPWCNTPRLDGWRIFGLKMNFLKCLTSTLIHIVWQKQKQQFLGNSLKKTQSNSRVISDDAQTY